MKTIALLVILNVINMLNLNFSQAQVTLEWEKYFQVVPYVAYGNCVESDNQGNCIVSGHAKIAGSIPIVTLKYNSQGVLLWQRTCEPYGGVNDVNDMVVDDAGNIYLTGFSTQFSDKSMFTIKYNPSGDTLWVKIYNGIVNGLDEGNAITLDKWGNVYVTGYSEGTGTNKDYLTIKYDSIGNQIWVRQFNYFTNNRNVANDIVTDELGNVYITGETEWSGGAYFYFTIKYDNEGNLIWGKVYAAPGSHCIAKAMAIDNAGNIYVTGWGRGVTNSDDYITIKYDPDGNQKWVKVYNSPGNFAEDAAAINLIYPLGINETPNVVVTGTSYNDFLTINMTGDSGKVVWEKRYNGSSNSLDFAKAMDTDENGNVYVTGSSYDNTTTNDFLTIKYNSAGNEIWNKRFNSLGTGQDVAEDISVGPNGAVFVAGSRDISGSVIVVLKYKEPSSAYTLDLTLFIEGFYNDDDNKMIKDTVRVYLRNSFTPFSIVDSAISLLDSNGNASLNFSNAFNLTPYYIMIQHRNSIETWSNSPVSFNSNYLDYDFTTSASMAYGDNMIQVDNSPVRYAIYSGDIDKDGVIGLDDVIEVNNYSIVFATGYLNTDLNGDDITDISDVIIAFNGSAAFINVVTPLGKSIPEKKSGTGIIGNIETAELTGNYPNPFNPVTNIVFRMNKTELVTLKVFDITGREVATLVNGLMDEGNHSLVFDASNLSSGTYFYKLESGEFSMVKRMMVVK